jgi:chromosome segregation ATPase
MSKTLDEVQQEIAQLLIRAGEAQFMLRMFRKTIEDKNSELNSLNQKIENKQKEYQTLHAQINSKAPLAVAEVPPVAEQPTPEETNAVASPEVVSSAP